MKKNITAQRGASGMVAKACGYTTNTSPGPEQHTAASHQWNNREKCPINTTHISHCRYKLSKNLRGGAQDTFKSSYRFKATSFLLAYRPPRVKSNSKHFIMLFDLSG